MKTHLFHLMAAVCMIIIPPVFAQKAGMADKASTGPDLQSRYKNASLPMEERVNDLVSKMTLEEKVSQMVHDAPAIPRLGIPEYKWWNECLHGVAGSYIATVFPQAIGLAATWNPALVHRVAVAISDEARAIYNDAIRKNKPAYIGLTFWSPNINLFRDPRWGRGQETYGEDPYLTSRLAVAFITGLQGNDTKYLKLVSTPKHYAVHSGPDPQRHTFNALANQRDMYETFLPHFEAAVREGGAYSVMCAYNRTNNFPCCGSIPMQEEILRKNWGFKGYIVSDCGAIEDIYLRHKFVKTAPEAAALAVKNGCDLCCGSAYLKLVEAVRLGLVTEDVINTAVKRLFMARFRLGMFDPPEMAPYSKIPFSVVDSAPHRQLALEAARESIVLLKNEKAFLPLKKGAYNTIAVIGPNANTTDVLLGNYNGTPSHAVTPFEGIRKKAAPDSEVIYVKGCDISGGGLELVPSNVLKPADGAQGAHGLKGEYFNNMELKGKPALTRVDSQINFDWGQNSPADGVNADSFSARWNGVITPVASGKHVLCLTTDDGVRVSIDGKRVIDDWTQHAPKRNSATIDLKAGRAYKIVIEYYEDKIGAVARFEWAVPETDPFKKAEEAAKQADLVVFVPGIDTSVENEERDRTDIALPAIQDELYERVRAAGKPVVVVALNGSALALNRQQETARAVIEAWYPGEEGGTAIADVLFGDYNPGGRLPVTFYKSLKQLPKYTSYNMADGFTYKYFKGDPLYPFGCGLSYTTFKYENLKTVLKTDGAGRSVTVSVDVTNTGARQGDEIVQVYVKPSVQKVGSLPTPSLQLQGFKRISLKPGGTQNVSFELGPDRLSIVNAEGRKVVEPGTLNIFVGGGQPGFEKTHGNYTVLGAHILISDVPKPAR
ncbi:MAG: glycoside hydrolase family 3 C-terminal domain-containing protein [bacterium]|nr:glycoside hydrolase family 3 C-terminal domain-containing protein [Candidatus Sumerlaeota bacterium]